MTEENKEFFICENVGISGITPVVVKRNTNGTFEARMGVSIMGSTNMTEEDLDACGRDPFKDNFLDNFVWGVGNTQEEAIEALKKDHKNMADLLWASW